MKRFKMFFGVGIILIISSVVFALVPSEAEGAVPKLLNFQGILRDGSGASLSDSTVSVEFKIYDAASLGNVKWMETQSVTTDTFGLFNVILGTATGIEDSVFKDSVRYLGVKVETDPELSPRSRLVSVAYANRVSTVDGATGGTISGNTSIQSDLSVAGSIKVGASDTVFSSNISSNSPLSLQAPAGSTRMFINDATGNVGIGTTAPTTPLQVNGTVTATSFLGSFGNNVTTVYGTAALTVSPATSSTPIPGLTQTIIVPSNSILYIGTEGGVQTTNSSTTGFSFVDVDVFIDGTSIPDGGRRRIAVLNNGGITGILVYWSLSFSTVLSPGSHTIHVSSQGVGIGSNAIVSGNTSSHLQGQLTIAVIKQ